MLGYVRGPPISGNYLEWTFDQPQTCTKHILRDSQVLEDSCANISRQLMTRRSFSVVSQAGVLLGPGASSS